MLTKIEITKSAGIECRTRLNHSMIGTRPLHVSIVQVAHQYVPNRRFQNAVRSISSPLYQAMKNSVRYAYSTISDVSRQSLAIASKCFTVTYGSSPKTFRSGTMSVITIATPE